MTENKEAGWNVPGLGLGIFLVLMLLIKSQFNSEGPTVGKDVRAGFQTISVNDANSLVGLSASELRQTLGKPDDVQLPSRYALKSHNSGNEAATPGERWIYFRKVNHEASGTKMGLSCDIQDGNCVAIQVY